MNYEMELMVGRI